MKLISLYIENFGGLSQYELEFEAGITTVMEPNGFGKTTLAEFIRAMLYGFPRKSKTLEKSLRQKYAPWNGGQYGGNLVFEHQGQCYRVERTFGATPKGDTFTLIDLSTNRKTDRFSEELGQEIFGLDADSFERSTYLPQMREEGQLATASIQAKLTQMVEDGSDVANFDKAITTLRAKRSALIPYRGSGGSVAEASGKITELQLLLDTAEMQRERHLTLQQEAVQTEAELEQTQAELSAMQQKIADAAQAAEASVRQEQYVNLSGRYQQVSAQAVALLRAFPAGFPDTQALRSAETAAEHLEFLKTQTITTAADRHAQTVLEANPRFAAHLPTAAQIAHCRSNCEKYEALQSRIRAAEQENTQRPKKSDVPAIMALVFGIATALAGGWMVLRHQFLYGGIAAVIGGIAVVSAILRLYSRRKHIQKSELVAELYRDSDQCSAEIRNFLAPYFGTVETNFLSTLTQLQHDLEAYTQAQQQLHDWHSRKAKHDAELEKCSRELAAFFDRYQIDPGENLRNRLYRLREDVHEARSLLAQKQELAAQLDELRRNYGNSLHAERTPKTSIQDLNTKAQTLRAAATELSGRLLAQKQELQALRQQAERVTQLREEQDYWRCKLAQDREDAEILDATMAFLQQAKANLSTAYLSTIQSRFGYYLSQLDGVSGEKYLIDTELQVQLERHGKARELAYFSVGQTDLVMLCMRLALVDALFKEQQVFVILDDPFVNLDDAHTAQARRLLHKLASRRQILYLTCHSSRTI